MDVIVILLNIIAEPTSSVADHYKTAQVEIKGKAPASEE